ncbi:MAG: hypothetical protein KGH63_03665, partial [Candidatus Micrarchaeota archaeon]|nr:hypothetical protein [Candidatus Micrarchaeota archaeon]
GADAYYVLTAAVSYNLSTPCPERIEVEYDYPSRNFVKRNDTLVSGCQVCTGGPNCVISYPEEAIIASHTYNGSDQVTSYITTYPSATPTTTLLDTYNGQHNVWEVNWSAASAPNALSVHLSQAQNQIIDITTAPQASPTTNSS